MNRSDLDALPPEAREAEVIRRRNAAYAALGMNRRDLNTLSPVELEAAAHAALSQQRLAKPAKTPKRLPGTTCPKCHGQQFKLRRSTGRRLAVVAFTPIALRKQNRVECVTCGTIYHRNKGAK